MATRREAPVGAETLAIAVDPELLAQAREAAAALGVDLESHLEECLRELTAAGAIEPVLAELRELSRQGNGHRGDWLFHRDALHDRP